MAATWEGAKPMGFFGWKLCLFIAIAIAEILYIAVRIRFGPNVIAGYREYRRERERTRPFREALAKARAGGPIEDYWAFCRRGHDGPGDAPSAPVPVAGSGDRPSEWAPPPSQPPDLQHIVRQLDSRLTAGSPLPVERSQRLQGRDRSA